MVFVGWKFVKIDNRLWKEYKVRSLGGFLFENGLGDRISGG